MDGFTFLIPITKTLQNAWGKINGSKKTFWAALAYLFIISILLALIYAWKGPYYNLVYFIGNIFLILLSMGCLYIGINRAKNLPIFHQMVFKPVSWNIGFKIIVCYVLEVIIFMLVGFILLIPSIVIKVLYPDSKILFTLFFILPVIGVLYFAVRLYLTFALIVDKEIGPFKAIKKSFEATRKNFWRILAIIILSTLIIIVSIIPLGLGLIWTLPFAYILYGEVYQSLLPNIKSDSSKVE